MERPPLLLLLPLLPLATLAQAPAFYWPLNETSGTVAHASAGGSDGLVQGNTEWLPTGGHHGGALRLNGNNARVDLGSCDITQGAGNTFSVACWFKPEIVSGTERTLVAKALARPMPTTFGA